MQNAYKQECLSRTDDSRLLQESNLTAKQPRRAPHHVIQATMRSEGLAQCPYVAARAGFEPATLRTEDTELTIEPKCLLCVRGGICER